MGQEIVYCVRCATRLAGADFDRGKAYRAGGKVVCSTCLPELLPTLTPEEQNSVVHLSSSKMRVVKSASASSHSLGSQGTSVKLTAQKVAAPAEKSPLPLILACVGGALLLLVIIGVVASGSGAPPPEPPSAAKVDRAPKPEEAPAVDKREDAHLREARDALAAARDKAKAAPEDLDGQLAAWEEAVRRSALTPFFKDASAGLQEIRDRRAAVKPPPLREPQKPIIVPPPVELPAKPASPDVAAYLTRWQSAMAKASARDYDEAIAELERAAAQLGDEAVKEDAKSDAMLLKRAKALRLEAQAAFAQLSTGTSIAVRSRGETGEPVQVEGSVVRAGADRLELRRGEEPLFVEIEDVTAGSLAERLSKLAEPDRRALAILCLLEGDVPAAERLAGIGGLPTRAWDYGNGGAARVPKASPRELEARARYYAAEREFPKMETLAAAVLKYRSLVQDYADTRLVKSESIRIQKRAEAGKDYLFLARALKGTGTFGLAPSPRTEIAWTSRADLESGQPAENFVEAEFAALPETAYRCWALVAGCCAENLVFYLQTTEGTEIHPKTRQKASIDPGASLAALVKHSLTGLKKTHEEHKVKGSKTHPKTASRWEWIPIALPKYAAAGVKKIRFISDQQGFAVGAVAVSSTRTTPVPDAELKEEIARTRTAIGVVQEGLAGWWRLDETSGTLVSNAVEGGPPGVLHGNAKWTAGKVGGALKVGSGHWVHVDWTASFKTITVSAWVKHEAFTKTMQRYVTVGRETAVIRCQADGIAHFYIRTDEELRHLYVPGALEAGKWALITGTWDGTTQKLYKDGVLISSATPGGTLTGESSRVQINAGGEATHGLIDEVRVYTRPLSEVEIRKLHAEGSAGTTGEAVPETLAPGGKPWRPLFDGKSLSCLKNGGSGWTVDNGTLTFIPGTDDAAQTRDEFSDGELRVRFEGKDLDKLWFNLRQGAGGGYGVSSETLLKVADGKVHDLVFVAKGEQVTATLDGKPVPVNMSSASRSGYLQFNARGKSFRIHALEVR